jgi:hypothetical protein
MSIRPSMVPAYPGIFLNSWMLLDIGSAMSLGVFGVIGVMQYPVPAIIKVSGPFSEFF